MSQTHDSKSTERAAGGLQGRGVGSPGGPVQTKTTRLRARVLDRLDSSAFRQEFERVLRELWRAEVGGTPLGTLWLYRALCDLPSYRLLPPNVCEELHHETLQSLDWLLGALKFCEPDGNARRIPRYWNREAERVALEEARVEAGKAGVVLTDTRLRQIRDDASHQPFLSVEDAFVQSAMSSLDEIARRYRAKQPVRVLLDQDLGEDDALLQITVPARGFQVAVNDASAVAKAEIEELNRSVGREPWFLFTRSQSVGARQEPNELGELLRHELRDYAFNGAEQTIWAWLREKRGTNRALAREFLARTGWSVSLGTVEKELGVIRKDWQAKDPETGTLVWPYELECSYGPLRSSDSEENDRPCEVKSPIE